MGINRAPARRLGVVLLWAAASAWNAEAALTWPGCPDLTAADFKDVILVNKAKDPTLNEPIGMEIGKDGRILFTERTAGLVKLIDLDGTIKVLGAFKVHPHSENGLRYASFDPDFASNRWIYTVMTPLAPKVLRISRMKLKADWTIDTNTVKVILDMPWSYETGHQGGAMTWDIAGNMFVSTGNNKHNGDDYSVTNETVYLKDNGAGTANTNDWRGKILRIKPIPFSDAETPAAGAGRTYSVPDGNLRQVFTASGLYGAADQSKILPEIYAMGLRNPYTLIYDPYTLSLSWGDIGADAGKEQLDRGPAGVDEFNLIKSPGFMGWPYFVGPNLAYVKWDYVNNVSLNEKWDVKGPVNTSINNTGVAKLPPAQPAILSESHQDGVTGPFFPKGGGAASITGPIYHYDGRNPSTRKLPPHFDGKWIIGEFSRHWLKAAALAPDQSKVTELNDFPGGIPNQFRLLNLQIGPDGALYYLNYSGWMSTDAETRIGRLEYTGTCRPSLPVPTLPSALANPGDRRRLTAPGTLGRISIPEGYRMAEVFDLSGRLSARAERDAAGGIRVRNFSRDAGNGMSMIRYVK
jgi:cytochrome c